MKAWSNGLYAGLNRELSGLKCYVPTKAHPERGQTLRYLLGTEFDERFPIVIVVNKKEELEQLEEQGINWRGGNGFGWKHEAIVLDMRPSIYATGTVRDAIAAAAGKGNWYLGIDDNIASWLTCDPDRFHEAEVIDWMLEPESARKIFSRLLHPRDVADVLADLIGQCEKEWTNYGGLAQRENPFQRPRKWGKGCVRTKAFVHCPDGRPFMLDPCCGVLEDAVKAWDTIARYGRTVINQWVYPKRKAMFQVGGIGSLAEREEPLKTVVAWAMKRWPGLLKPSDAFGYEGIGANPALHGKRLEAWRMEWLREHPAERPCRIGGQLFETAW